MKENSEFKPVKLRLKIDLVSYPARAEGLVNRIISISHYPQIPSSKYRKILTENTSILHKAKNMEKHQILETQYIKINETS